MFVRFALIGATVPLLAACNDGSSNGDDGGSASGGEDADLEGEFPTEEFGLTDRELVTRIEAIEAAIAGCMAGAGFEYVPLDADTVRDAMDGLGGPRGARRATGL